MTTPIVPAHADCLRHVINRSPLVLLVSQDGGPSVTVRPRSSRSIRLSAPGQLDLAAYCSPSGLGAPVAQRSFTYNVVLDRCSFEIGYGFFERELGVGFLPRRGTAPFTLNNPKQGDIVLAADRSACLGPR
ncbi:hypothetical protein [uncultured Methylobacterium sp.]|uniref:hypothetical protein n=1 Tax=uncultured Methylobacterium sp. TaxID=157278 RepID=UPI0035CADED1